MIRRVAALLLACLLAVFSEGCDQNAAGIDEGTAPSRPTETGEVSPTLPPPLLPETEAMTLRIAAHAEDNMNPLYPKHTDTRAIFSLVYEPLLRVTADGRAEGVLAQSVAFNASNDMLRVEIRDGALFQNNAPVRAEDVAACFREVIRQVTGIVPEALESPSAQFERDAAAHSVTTSLRDILADGVSGDVAPLGRELTLPQEGGFDPAPFSTLYRDRVRALSNIASVSVEAGVLYVGLRVPDRNAVQYLTFPVIPEGFVGNTISLTIPGSGDWQIEPGGFRGQYTLRRVSEGEGLAELNVLPFDRMSDAVRAFDDGEIDLLFMDETTAPLYAARGRIRKQRFEAPGFTALYFAGRDASALALRDRFNAALRRRSGTENELAAPHERAEFPILRGDWRLEGSFDLFQDRPSPPSVPTSDQQDAASRFLLLIPEGYVPARLIRRLEPVFSAMNLALDVKSIASEDWFNALREDDYDGAILTDMSCGVLDPVDWLDSVDEAGLFAWREETDADDVAALEALSACPVVSDASSQAPNDGRYATALMGAFDLLPVVGIGGFDTMVWYGSDVRGTLSGTWNAPFNRIERLTVWRP